MLRVLRKAGCADGEVQLHVTFAAVLIMRAITWQRGAAHTASTLRGQGRSLACEQSGDQAWHQAVGTEQSGDGARLLGW